MDAKQFYDIKFEILVDLAHKLAEAKRVMVRLAEHEAKAACPDEGELFQLQVDLDAAEESADFLLDAVRPMIGQ